MWPSPARATLTNNMNNYLIYIITNTINNKSYIGQTKNWKNRWKKHNQTSNTSAISKAIQKYRKENFKVKFLITKISKESADHLETLFIDLNNTLSPKGYNIKEGGTHENPFAGYTTEQWEEWKQENKKRQRNPKTIEKQRKAQTGDRNPMKRPEVKLKNSKSNKGKRRKSPSPKTRQLISNSLKGRNNPQYGKQHTKENKKRISKGMKTYWAIRKAKDFILDDMKYYG